MQNTNTRTDNNNAQIRDRDQMSELGWMTTNTLAGKKSYSNSILHLWLNTRTFLKLNSEYLKIYEILWHNKL